MKKLILLAAIVVVVASGIAAQKRNSVSVKYKNFSLSFVQEPLEADGKLLPFIDGAVASGTKERFGVYFGTTLPTTPCVEILDAQNNVLQTLSVNDILGKGVSKEEKLLPSNAHAKPRRAENIYTVRLPKGEAQVIVKAIATEDDGNPDQQLVVTFALKTDVTMDCALRVKLPLTGNAEAANGGVVFTPKSGSVALAASIYPLTKKLTVEKSRIVVASASQTMQASEEMALLWFVIKGVSSSSSTDAKTQAQRVIKDNTTGNDEPRLVVVTAVDKEKLLQADTASYTLVCANIGVGEAVNVVLGNPVPKGARYIEGSATTAGMVFSVEATNAAQSGEGQSLKWTSPTALKPGEERIVSFKVVLQ